MLNELLLESVPVVLEEEDLNAMYFSVENRSPFLNHKLFEYLNSVDTKYFIKKWICKKFTQRIFKIDITESYKKKP